MMRDRIPGIRASLAMSPQITRTVADELLGELERLYRERDEIRAELASMGSNWRDVRDALNRLSRRVADSDRRSA